MRISDWSSDVCSSDLGILAEPLVPIEDHGFAALLRHGDGHDLVSELALAPGGGGALVRSDGIGVRLLPRDAIVAGEIFAIGRASCREGVCQYVSISVVACSLKTKTRIHHRSPY